MGHITADKGKLQGSWNISFSHGFVIHENDVGLDRVTRAGFRQDWALGPCAILAPRVKMRSPWTWTRHGPAVNPALSHLGYLFVL